MCVTDMRQHATVLFYYVYYVSVQYKVPSGLLFKNSPTVPNHAINYHIVCSNFYLSPVFE